MDVYPSLTYRDVDAALEFLTTAFGLEPASVWRDDEGTLHWAELAYGQGRVLVQPDMPDQLHGTHLGRAWVYLAVVDPDGHYERARDAGAEIVGEPHGSEEQGQRGYSARDPEANLWSFGTDRLEAEHRVLRDYRSTGQIRGRATKYPCSDQDGECGGGQAGDGSDRRPEYRDGRRVVDPPARPRARHPTHGRPGRVALRQRGAAAGRRRLSSRWLADDPSGPRPRSRTPPARRPWRLRPRVPK